MRLSSAGVRARHGFTLIELVIVIVIIGILALVSGPVYHAYVRRAVAAEGRALLGSISKAQKIYLMQYQAYRPVSSTGYDDVLDVDARMNRYFNSFQVTAGGTARAGDAAFTAVTAGSGEAAGITMTLIQSFSQAPVVTASGI